MNDMLHCHSKFPVVCYTNCVCVCGLDMIWHDSELKNTTWSERRAQKIVDRQEVDISQMACDRIAHDTDWQSFNDETIQNSYE